MATLKDDFDVFISHASEDKAELVRPLAEMLQKFGLRVWFDEQVLQIGDSLSRSIDAGLVRSRFGIVVISSSFLSKKWPEYELRGLVSREMLGGSSKVILPIWFNVSPEDVLAYSPTLADKVALRYPEESLLKVAMSVLKVIDPERARHLIRYLLYRQKVANAEPSDVVISELKRGPIRHPELPQELVVRIRLMHLAFGDAALMSLEDTFDNFKRDVDPARDLAIWERIAAAFLEIAGEYDLGADARENLVRMLLRVSFMSNEELMAEINSEDVSRRFVSRSYVGAGVDPTAQDGDEEEE